MFYNAHDDMPDTGCRRAYERVGLFLSVTKYMVNPLSPDGGGLASGPTADVGLSQSVRVLDSVQIDVKLRESLPFKAIPARVSAPKSITFQRIY